MRRPLVAGNWKMNGSLAMAGELSAAVVAASVAGVDTVLCPPTAYLAAVRAATAGSSVLLGGQDCSEYEAGAYTGECAAEMLSDLGAEYVLVGHSERRQFFGDNDVRVAAKVERAYTCGLTPVLCVGETLEQRRAGDTERVIEAQLESVLQLGNAQAILGRLVIAYEPVWAIGTGESATPEQAQAVHAWMRKRLALANAEIAERLRLLYGGSVKPDNAAELFAMPDIDGGLIGGASLSADPFIAVCQAAA